VASVRLPHCRGSYYYGHSLIPSPLITFFRLPTLFFSSFSPAGHAHPAFFSLCFGGMLFRHGGIITRDTPNTAPSNDWIGFSLVIWYARIRKTTQHIIRLGFTATHIGRNGWMYGWMNGWIVWLRGIDVGHLFFLLFLSCPPCLSLVFLRFVQLVGGRHDDILEYGLFFRN